MGVQTAPARRSLIGMSQSAEQHEPNETLRAVRQGLLMSQGDFALAIRAAGQRAGEPNDCTKRLIQRWEAGYVTGIPRGNYARALEAVTGQPIENLGFRGTDPGRRQVLGATAAASVAWALPESAKGARGPLTGIWRSRYEYPSSSRGAMFSSQHHVIVIQHGARLQVRSLQGSGQGMVTMDLAVNASVVTGTWQEQTDAAGYYSGATYSGAIQMLVDPSGHRIAGQWVGFGRSFDVNTGPWTLDLVSSDTSKAAMERYSRPVITTEGD